MGFIIIVKFHPPFLATILQFAADILFQNHFLLEQKTFEFDIPTSTKVFSEIIAPS